MRPFREFERMDPSFWAFIKFISEILGYTERGLGKVKTYSAAEIRRLCRETNTAADEASVAYFCAALSLITGPPPIWGWFVGSYLSE